MATAQHLKIGDAVPIAKNYQEFLEEDNGTFVVMQQTGTGLPQVWVVTARDGHVESYLIPQPRTATSTNTPLVGCKISESTISLPAGTRAAGKSASQR